jgi:carbon-monoxide dehydrogenase medium subunit
MKPADFEYVRPRSIDEAVRALAQANGEGKVLAGGQSLVPLMNFRLASPRVLVDLHSVPGIDRVESKEGFLHIGAMARTRLLETDPAVRQTVPVLAAAASWVGHVQIRNRGTVGGSVAHADPAAEIPAICILLDAELDITGAGGTRTVPASEFFLGLFTTQLDESDVLTAIRFPIRDPNERWGFREFAHRRGDFALAGAAVMLSIDGDSVQKPRIAIFGTSDRPIRASAAEAAIADGPPTPERATEVARIAADEAATEDPRPDAAYRKAVTATMVARALEDAVSREAAA